MSCPFLSGRQIKMCAAFNGSLVLSVEELNSLCSSPAYHACKMYQKCQKAGNKLPLHEYTKSYILPSV
jgi:hypothetical protein